jgi:hypothetical protein
MVTFRLPDASNQLIDPRDYPFALAFVSPILSPIFKNFLIAYSLFPRGFSHSVQRLHINISAIVFAAD